MRQKVPKHYVHFPAVCQRQFHQIRGCSFGAAAADKLSLLLPSSEGNLTMGPGGILVLLENVPFRAQKKLSNGSSNLWEVDPGLCNKETGTLSCDSIVHCLFRSLFLKSSRSPHTSAFLNLWLCSLWLRPHRHGARKLFCAYMTCAKVIFT